MKVQKLLSLIRQSCERYEMIEEGDKIAVGVSGGKDSLTLLYGLKELSRFYPKHFTVTAICVDLGYACFHSRKILLWEIRAIWSFPVP